MTEILASIERLRAAGTAAVMGTLVANRGLGPRRAGARLWIDARGHATGAITVGGCVDTRVAEAAAEVLAGAPPRLLTVDLREEEALDFGFSCAGAVDVLLEPLRLADPADPVIAAYRAAAADVEAGARIALVARCDGGGGRLRIDADGAAHGTLGSTVLDRAAAQAARDRLSAGLPSALVVAGADGADTPLFVEIQAPRPHLVVFGTGPVAQPLARLAGELGMPARIVDGRAGVAAGAAAGMRFGAATIVVLVAHDYRQDLPVLRHVLGTEAGFVGLLGSRRRARALLDFLADEGVPRTRLERVRAPVGLDIGAESPAELALSILAEAMAVLTGRSGRPLADVKAGAGAAAAIG